jgi:hypothetical protein
MSVRSERSNLDTGMAAIDLNAAAHAPIQPPSNHVEATIGAAQAADSSLSDANTLATNHPEHPLKRTVVATIRASLGDLCLRKQKATWAPSAEALRAILQQKKFTSLSGTAEAVGDLKVRLLATPHHLPSAY